MFVSPHCVPCSVANILPAQSQAFNCAISPMLVLVLLKSSFHFCPPQNPTQICSPINNPRSSWLWLPTMKLQCNISVLYEASEGSRKSHESKTSCICQVPFATIEISFFWLRTCFWLTIPLSIISTQERCQWRLYLPWDFYSYLGPVEGPIKWIGRWRYPHCSCYWKAGGAHI